MKCRGCIERGCAVGGERGGRSCCWVTSGAELAKLSPPRQSLNPHRSQLPFLWSFVFVYELLTLIPGNSLTVRDICIDWLQHIHLTLVNIEAVVSFIAINDNCY